jgi:hypothetical protein
LRANQFVSLFFFKKKKEIFFLIPLYFRYSFYRRKMVAATDKNIQDVHQSINAQEDTVNQKGNEIKDVNIKVDAEVSVFLSDHDN